MSRHPRFVLVNHAVILVLVTVLCASASASSVRIHTDGGGVGAWSLGQVGGIDWQQYDSGTLNVLSHTMPVLTADSATGDGSGHAQAEATASIGQFHTRITMQGMGGLAGGAGYGQVQILRLRWDDHVTFHHDTLTEVEVVAQMVIEGSIPTAIATGDGSFSNLTQIGFSGTSIYGNFNLYHEASIPAGGNPALSFPILESEAFTASVDHALPIAGGLALTGFAIGGSTGNGGSGDLTIDMLSTANFHFIPVTPGTTFTTGSGVPLVIPAPHTLAMMYVGGLLALGRRRPS